MPSNIVSAYDRDFPRAKYRFHMSPNILLKSVASLGTLLAAMGCAACFPLLGSLAAAVGLGFLAAFEGPLINHILPGFALFALIVNSYLWGRNALHVRGALSLAGPLAVLLTLYPLWKYSWSSYLLYAGIALMLLMAVYEFIRPARAACVAKSAA